MRSPKGSSASASSAALGPGAGATVPDSACGTTFFFFFSCGGGVAGGVGGAAAFLVSNDPTWSLPLYFLRMLSLWYFQNCFEASFPATRWRTVERGQSTRTVCFIEGLGRDLLFLPPVIGVSRSVL